MKSLIFVLTFVLAIPVLAQDPVPAVASAPAAATETVATPAAPVEEPIKITVDGDKVTIQDVVIGAGEVAKAVADYKAAKGKSDKASLSLMLMALLAAIFKLVLSAVRLTGSFWKTPRGKTITRLITLALGVGVFLTSSMAGGMGWMEAIVAGMSGPLALAFHEYTYLIPSLAAKKEAAKKVG